MSEISNWWFIGNHARAIVKEDQPGTKVNYCLSQAIEDNHGSLSFSPTDNSDRVAYTTEALRNAIEERMKNQSEVLLMGDISERLMEAAIRAGVSSRSLKSVYILYPVGMVAFDCRKEMSEIILTLKKAQVPTFLIREPEAFFDSFEPNSSSFVEKCLGENHRGVAEYLCGIHGVVSNQ